MAAILGHDATQYEQIVPAPSASTEFQVGLSGDNLPMVPRGKKAFTSLANGDTIFYKAVSLEDPTKWEVGKGTYDSVNETIDRTDANVWASSSSDNRVNFRKADGSGAMVHIIGLAGVAATIVALTDNSAGTANDTVQALADGTTYANDVAAIRNNFADLAAKVNEIIANLKAADAVAGA